jgi:isopentenyldiphosphate isomerase
MAEDELLDVLRRDGTSTGVRKPREAVHRDGDWHAAFHLWVVQPGGVLLQRRGAGKRAWPGRLDATAAGHLTAGETVADGLREVREELGLELTMDALTPLGVHVVDEQHGGRRNRERQHVFALADARPLDHWTEFERAEIDGLVLVDHDAFSSLVAGRGDQPALAFDGRSISAMTVHSNELIPAPYLPLIAQRLRELGIRDPA